MDIAKEIEKDADKPFEEVKKGCPNKGCENEDPDHEHKQEATSKTENRALKPIFLREGVALPESVEQQFRLAKLYFDSKMVPERFESPVQVVAALHFAAEHFPSSPLTALRQIAIIQGVPTAYGDLPLAIVQASGKLKLKREYLIDKDGTEICVENKNLTSEMWAAVCHTIRREFKRDGFIESSHTTVFSVDDAKVAKLWNKKTSTGRDTPWVTFPKRMMKYRARAENLKDHFADCLNGLAQAEYDINSTLDDRGEPIDVIQESGAAEINRIYLEKKECPQSQL